MKKKKRGLVEWQHLSETTGSTGSYDRYTSERTSSSSFDGAENVLANPDSLPAQDSSPSSPQQLMGEAIQHLQGRQKEVYLLVMREDKSIAEAGEVLDISKGTAQTYLDRAIKFITAYCKQGMDGGRV